MSRARAARRHDPDTSHAAADAIEPRLSDLQERVLEAFRFHGPMTARTAENLPEFRDMGFSTVRKRISELKALGELVEDGVDRSYRAPAAIFRAPVRRGQAELF